MLFLLLQKILIYGCLGILIEFFFTAVHSIIFSKDKNATGHSFLWMLPIYGFTALVLECLSEALPWPFYIKALIYVPIIYGTEALSGWTIKQLIGTIPWDYEDSPWTPMGLINLKFAPFWLALAMAFDPITRFLTKLLNAIALIA